MIAMHPRALALRVGQIADLVRAKPYQETPRTCADGSDGLEVAEVAEVADPAWQRFALDILSASPMFSRRFAATAAQVRPVRAFVAGLLGDGHPCRDDAMLLTSELAGNVSVHAAEREFVVSVVLVAGGVVVAVRDAGSPKIPCPRKPEVDEPGGRGLALVDMLTTRWGFHRDAGGTTVCFHLSSPS
jgi:anti-sigma regulatory factor (Ser/Thr protein kinase)